MEGEIFELLLTSPEIYWSLTNMGLLIEETLLEIHISWVEL